MKLNGLQADYLLYALDAYCKTDSRGQVTINPLRNNTKGGLAFVQKLRDGLMAIHEHGDDNADR
jgi:hypothetical protein